MGDMGELFNDLKVHRKGQREAKLALAKAAQLPGWTMHTEYHWSRVINGIKLDWWPSRGKWAYGKNGNKPIIHNGNQEMLLNFIKNRMVDEVKSEPDVSPKPAPDIDSNDESVPWD